MKKFIVTALLINIISVKCIFAAGKTVVVTGFDFDSPRTSVLAAQMEIHFNSAMENHTTLDYVNPEDFRSLTAKKKLRLENDITSLASTLDISAVIFVRIIDRVSEIEFIIEAYGTDIPYNGAKICTLDKIYKTDKQVNESSYNLISEDIAVQFLIKFLDTYEFPVFPENPSVEKKYFRMDEIEGIRTWTNADEFHPGVTFYFSDLREESENLSRQFYSKKKEIIYQPSELETTLFLFTLTPLFSTISPLASPVNYYLNGRYADAAWWLVSSSPYYYIMAQGFMNNPGNVKNSPSHDSISKFDNANYVFAWYQMLAGGTAFFIDSAVNRRLQDSANYISRESYLDNDEYAVFLSLICGGAGHFYKGNRGWGYFFYHTDAILLYSTIYFLSSDENYSQQQNGYVSGGSDRAMAAVSGSMLAAVKIFEIYHLLHTESRPVLGTESENLISFDVLPDEYGNFIFSATRKF